MSVCRNKSNIANMQIGVKEAQYSEIELGINATESLIRTL
jgi:hypothetical protein